MGAAGEVQAAIYQLFLASLQPGYPQHIHCVCRPQVSWQQREQRGRERDTQWESQREREEWWYRMTAVTLASIRHTNTNMGLLDPDHALLKNNIKYTVSITCDWHGPLIKFFAEFFFFFILSGVIILLVTDSQWCFWMQVNLKVAIFRYISSGNYIIPHKKIYFLDFNK